MAKSKTPPSELDTVESIPPVAAESTSWPSRSLGHLRDVEDVRDFPVRGVRAGIGTAWEKRPISGLRPDWIDSPRQVMLNTAPIRDQGGTSSCVGFAFARHINARLSYLTHRDPAVVAYPSEFGIYGVARRNDEKTKDGDYAVDSGCYPREAAKGMLLHGVCADGRWPFDPSKVNSALPWDVITAGYDAKVVAYHRVPSALDREEEFLQELEQLIFSGYTIPYAQNVDRAFNDYTGGVLTKHYGSTSGSHYTVLRGYDRDKRVMYGDNSWGTYWGDGGRYEISYDRLVSLDCFDFVVLTTVPVEGRIR